MPDQMAVHWNIVGEADNFMTKRAGLRIFPIPGLGLGLLQGAMALIRAPLIATQFTLFVVQLLILFIALWVNRQNERLGAHK